MIHIKVTVLWPLVANQVCCICGGGNTTYVISDVVTVIFEGELPGCEPPPTTASQFDESFKDYLSILLGRPSKLIDSSSINISVVGTNCHDDEISTRQLSQSQEGVYATIIIVTKVTIEKTTKGETIKNIVPNILNGLDLSDQLAVKVSEDVVFFKNSGGFLDGSAEVPSMTPTFVVFLTFETSSLPSLKSVTPTASSRKELTRWKTTAIVLATLLGFGVAFGLQGFILRGIGTDLPMFP